MEYGVHYSENARAGKTRFADMYIISTGPVMD